MDVLKYLKDAKKRLQGMAGDDLLKDPKNSPLQKKPKKSAPAKGLKIGFKEDSNPAKRQRAMDKQLKKIFPEDY